MTRKVIEEWKIAPDKRIYLLTLDEIIPLKGANFQYYRIEGKLYKPVSMTFSLQGTRLIALEGEGGFVGKEVELVGKHETLPDKIVYDPDAPPACEKEMEELMKLCGEW